MGMIYLLDFAQVLLVLQALTAELTGVLGSLARVDVFFIALGFRALVWV